MAVGLDPDDFARRLQRAFGGGTGEAKAVARSAVDLADSGRYWIDTGHSLTAALILTELEDAPGGSPADRWNWWVGALEVAHGSYADFGVRRYPGESG